MKIYKISQTQNNDYDTYDSAVVIAENEEQAININPEYGTIIEDFDGSDIRRIWCDDSEHVNVEYIGEAREGSNIGVVCASFNAG